MIKKFQMEDNKLVNTPMVIGCKLRKDDDSKEVDQGWYRSMIGSLMYVIASNPGITQVFGMVARFHYAKKKTHA